MIGWLESQRKAQGENYLVDLNKGRFSSDQIPMSVAQSLGGKPAQKIARAHIMGEKIQGQEVPDLIEQKMLSGDFPEAHLHEKDEMDLNAVRFSPK